MQCWATCLRLAHKSLIKRVPVSNIGRRMNDFPLRLSVTELGARSLGQGRDPASECPLGGAFLSNREHLIRQRVGDAPGHAGTRAPGAVPSSILGNVYSSVGGGLRNAACPRGQDVRQDQTKGGLAKLTLRAHGVMSQEGRLWRCWSSSCQRKLVSQGEAGPSARMIRYEPLWKTAWEFVDTGLSLWRCFLGSRAPPRPRLAEGTEDLRGV